MTSTSLSRVLLDVRETPVPQTDPPFVVLLELPVTTTLDTACTALSVVTGSPRGCGVFDALGVLLAPFVSGVRARVDRDLRVGDVLHRVGDRIRWMGGDGRTFLVSVRDLRDCEEPLLCIVPDDAPRTLDAAAGLASVPLDQKPLPALDPAASGVFPALARVLASCSCGCGGPRDRGRQPVMRAAPAVPLPVLVAELEQSSLVRAALALADCAGRGARPEEFAFGAWRDELRADPALDTEAGPLAVLRAATAARVVVTFGDQLSEGEGAKALREGTDAERLDAWTALVAGVLRWWQEQELRDDDRDTLDGENDGREDDEREDDAGVVDDEDLSAVLDALAALRDPADLLDAVGTLSHPAELLGTTLLALYVEDLARLEDLATTTPPWERPVVGPDEQATAVELDVRRLVALGLAARRPAVEGGADDDAPVELTALGRWTAARILRAHGATLHERGSLHEVAPDAFLDGIAVLHAADWAWELSGWLHARGDGAARALHRMLRSAAGPQADRPARRKALGALVALADPASAVLLDEACAAQARDPWLAVPIRLGLAMRHDGPVQATDLLWSWVDILGASPESSRYTDGESAWHHLVAALQTADLTESLLHLDHPQQEAVWARIWAKASEDLEEVLDPRVYDLVRRSAERRRTSGRRAAPVNGGGPNGDGTVPGNRSARRAAAKAARRSDTFGRW